MPWELLEFLLFLSISPMDVPGVTIRMGSQIIPRYGRRGRIESCMRAWFMMVEEAERRARIDSSFRACYETLKFSTLHMQKER